MYLKVYINKNINRADDKQMNTKDSARMTVTLEAMF